MTQRWLDLLFAHWPISPDILRAHVPPHLELDTFNSQGWIGVVPFRMSNVRLRWTLSLPWLSVFLKLNVRTYVKTHNESDPKSGVYFFSLDADAVNPVAVAVARRWFKLPYFRVQMSLQKQGNHIFYKSKRTHKGAPKGSFRGSYAPIGNVIQSIPGTLEHWLTELYCLYAISGKENILRGEIHHKPWPLQAAEAEIEVNTVAASSGIVLPNASPLLHFARQLDVLVWPISRLS